MNIHEIIKVLRNLNEEVPIPLELPKEKDIEEVERKLGQLLHPDYKTYLLLASDVVYGMFEPFTAHEKHGNNYIPNAVIEAYKYGVPENLIPIVEDNSDYYCIDNEGKIIFWSHEGVTDEKWDSLAIWIDKVWINEE